ncbi:MAG: hypothetical protein ACJ74Q_15440 [Pyrinomonadaceae bacterium]
MDAVGGGRSYDEWVAEVVRLATAGGAGGVEFSPEEVSEVLGGGWQDVYASGEEEREAASLMRTLLDELRGHKARPERRRSAGDSWPTYGEWVAELRRIVTSAEGDDCNFTDAELDRALGGGWQDVYERAETAAEAAEAAMGFIRAARGMERPAARGRELSAAWACKQLGIHRKELERLDGDTLLLWAHADSADRDSPVEESHRVMKAEISRDRDVFTYGATDTLSADGHSFTFGSFVLEGSKLILLVPRPVEAGGGEKSFALLARVVRRINENPMESEGRAVSALWCLKPGLELAVEV